MKLSSYNKLDAYIQGFSEEHGVAITQRIWHGYNKSHRFDRTDIPINRQLGTEPRPVEIGDDVWIGQRVIIMPGVKIGSHSVIGAGAIVSKDVPEWAVVARIPARIIRMWK